MLRYSDIDYFSKVDKEKYETLKIDIFHIKLNSAEKSYSLLASYILFLSIVATIYAKCLLNSQVQLTNVDLPESLTQKSPSSKVRFWLAKL